MPWTASDSGRSPPQQKSTPYLSKTANEAGMSRATSRIFDEAVIVIEAPPPPTSGRVGLFIPLWGGGGNGPAQVVGTMGFGACEEKRSAGPGGPALSKRLVLPLRASSADSARTPRPPPSWRSRSAADRLAGTRTRWVH